MFSMTDFGSKDNIPYGYFEFQIFTQGGRIHRLSEVMGETWRDKIKVSSRLCPTTRFHTAASALILFPETIVDQ
jgi:hypothetical protein